MIFLYYVLAVTPDETKNPNALVDARTDSLVVLLIFAAYLAWDLASIGMLKRGYEIHFQWSRTMVTLVAFVLAGAICIIAWTASSPLNQHLAITVDSLFIAIVILYRWAKDCIVIVPQAAPPAKAKSATMVQMKSDIDTIRDAVKKLDDTIGTITVET